MKTNNLSIDNLLKTYDNSKFNMRQMEQIRRGLENGVKVAIYAKPEFNGQQMRQIRKGLEKNLM